MAAIWSGLRLNETLFAIRDLGQVAGLLQPLTPKRTAHAIHRWSPILVLALPYSTLGVFSFGETAHLKKKAKVM